MKARTERVVIYRLGSLGDTIVALPCLHKVAQVYPNAERVVLTNFPVSSKAAPLEAVLGGSGLVHRFLAYPVGTRSLRELSRLRVALRALDAATLIYLTPARGLAAAWRDWVFFRLCGFRRIIGTPLKRDLQQHRLMEDGFSERECERLARCMAPLGVVDLCDRAAWDLHLSDQELEEAGSALKDIKGIPRLVINMGGKVAQNDWGEGNWCALLAKLAPTFSDHALLLVGATEDSERADTAGRLWQGPVVNLCGRVPPRVSAAAMAGASLFVGHDSGPMHLAACVGVPCVGLFGDKNRPRTWHPMGTQHHLIHDMAGVRSISVDRVLQAVESMLGAHRQAALMPQPPLDGATSP